MDQPQAAYDADGQVIPVAQLRARARDLPNGEFHVETFHLPGEHDQSEHGRRGNGDGDGDGAKPKKTGGDARRAAARLIEAYDDGYTVDEFFPGGQSGALVQRVTLTNGEQAVRKRNLRVSPRDVRMEYLAGRVYNALTGDDDVVTAQVDETTLLTTLVKGPSGSREMMDKLPRGASDAQKRRVYQEEIAKQVELPGGKEIGMLDWITTNTDRHSLNWIITDRGVRPIDQGDVRFSPVRRVRDGTDMISTHKSPFADHWVGLEGARGGIITGVTPKFTEADVAGYRERLAELRDEFTESGESELFDAMMSRFEIVEQAVKS